MDRTEFLTATIASEPRLHRAKLCPLKRLNEMQETLGPRKSPANQAANVTCPICGALAGFRCVDHTGQIVSYHVERARAALANSATCFWRSSRRRDGRSTKPEGARGVAAGSWEFRRR